MVRGAGRKKIMRFPAEKMAVFFLILSGILFPAFLHADTLGKVAKELRKNNAGNELKENLSRYIEEREEYLKNAISSGKINKTEEKTIRRSLERLSALREKAKEKDSLSPGDIKNIRRELSHCYHLIYFYSRKDGTFTYDLYGKKFYLKEAWQKRFDRAALSRKDMEEMMSLFNKLWRMRNYVKDSENTPDVKAQKEYIIREGEKLLLEKYFTLEKPAVLSVKGSKSKKTIKDIKQKQKTEYNK